MADPAPAPAAATRVRGYLLAAAPIVPVLIALLAAWLAFGSYAHLFAAVDAASAHGPCRDGNGVRPLCDFANHYFPQGRGLATSPTAVPGFYYGGFFAVGMRLLAALDLAQARGLWAAVVVAAALGLLLLPPRLRLARSLFDRVVYGGLCALALPVWHDLLFGQVSALITVLVVLAFVVYDRRPVQAAVLLGLATSIKLYPALFALYFLLRKDRRAVIGFVATVGLASVALPGVVLGERGLVAFYASLWQNLRRLADFTAATPFGNNVANAVSHLVVGRVEPSSLLYRAGTAVGLLVAAGHLVLAGRSLRTAASARSALMLGLGAIPFLVRPCWMHYFVFLPLLSLYVLDGARRAGRRWLGHAARLSVGVATALVSVPTLLLVGQTRYYTAAAPFWATLCLLPGLYLAVLNEPAVEA